jgi:hypothetical protein
LDARRLLLMAGASLWLLCCRFGYEELSSGVLGGSSSAGSGATGPSGGNATNASAGDGTTNGGNASGGTQAPGDGVAGDGTAGDDSTGSAGETMGGNAGGGAGGSSAGGGAGGGSSGGGCTTATYGGHDYRVCNTPKSYIDAAVDCAGKGFYPVRIDSAGEQTFIHGLIPVADQNNNNTSLWRWLGASGSSGDWQWSDGTQFWTGGAQGMAVGGAYTNWNKNQPLNNQSCAAMEARAGTWYAMDCFATRPYVCEKY